MDLKTCPFCISHNVKLERGSDQDMQANIPKAYVRCTCCNAKGPAFSCYDYAESKIDELAKVYWNLRQA